MKNIHFVLLILCFLPYSSVKSQSTHLDRTSPSSGSAQLFFFDRTSNGVTDRNWRIVTLPASTNGTGDKVQIVLFGGYYPGSSAFEQTIHLGNRNGFAGFLRTEFGSPSSSVRIRAYQQSDGSVEVYLSLFAYSWKGASVRVYDGSGITGTRPIIYENPINIGPSPTGTLVFDSFDATADLSTNNSGDTFFRGKVGIRTTDLDEEVTIAGNVNVGAAANGMIKVRHVTGKSHTSTNYGNLYLNYHTSNPVIIGTGTNRADLILYGELAVGTNSIPAGYKLAVDGKAIVEEVKVGNSGSWPDFVFEDQYDLRTLDEVETFISENNHLPDIPNKAEVTENGINLGEMNAKLLQKVEELTLYLIAQNKQNLEQQKLIEGLQNEVAALKNE